MVLRINDYVFLDLARLYTLVNRIDQIDVLAIMLHDYVKAKGLQDVAHISKPIDVKCYIDTLLTTHLWFVCLFYRVGTIRHTFIYLFL